jgi:hypothetical protein
LEVTMSNHKYPAEFREEAVVSPARNCSPVRPIQQHMLRPENIFQFKLTLTDSVPEIWRRVLVPDECTLGDLHYVISYAFCWFDDSEHEFSHGSRVLGPKSKGAPAEREDEHEVLLLDFFKRPGDDIRYVLSLRDDWSIDVQLEGEQAPVPRGHYPCCIAGANDSPPDGVGGVSRHNEVVQAFHNPDAWKALCDEVGPVDWQFAFEPTYLDIGDINCALGLIFRVDEEDVIAPTSSIAAK